MKKIFITIGVTVLLLPLGLVLLYFLKPEFFVKEYYNKLDIPSEFNLSSDNVPLVGCVFGSKRTEYVCFNKTKSTFEEAPFLLSYKREESLDEGFILLQLVDSQWQIYDVNAQDIFLKWYKETDLNIKTFLSEQEDGRHVDLYNLVQFRVIQNRYSELEEDVFKEELETVSKEGYKITSPMRSDDWKYVCEITSDTCLSWEKYQKLPSYLFKSLNSDSSFDFKDLNNTWSRIMMLTVGLNSLSKENKEYGNVIGEYDKFIEKYISTYPNSSEEEIMFIGEYLPLGLVEYADSLYKGWSGKYENQYYYLINLYCFSSDSCLQSKLNIIHDEYED